MNNLPKNGWYVELPDNQNDIDLDKLNIAFKKETFLFYRDKGEKIYQYYYANQQGYIDGTDNCDVIGHLENVTHLFLKQDQKMDIANLSYGVKTENDIIEIDGKRYRKIDTGGSFEERDEVLLPDNKIGVVIGYDDNKLVVKADNKYIACGIALLKLEELKVKVWHYAICNNRYNVIYTSKLCESKDELDNEVKLQLGYILEYRIFEQQP